MKAHCEICGLCLKEDTCPACNGAGTLRIRRLFRYVQEKCTFCNGCKAIFECPSHRKHAQEADAGKTVYICQACNGTGIVWKDGTYEPCECSGGYWGAYLPKALRSDVGPVAIIDPTPPSPKHCAICGGRLKDVKCSACSGTGYKQGIFKTCRNCGGKGSVRKCINHKLRSHSIKRCTRCGDSGVVRVNDYGNFELGRYKRCTDCEGKHENIPITDSFPRY